MINHKIGRDVIIDKNAFLDPRAKIKIGDHSYIGPFVRIVGDGSFTIGDYSKIHFGTFINSNEKVIFGHNCWIAERCVIDGNGEIYAGNNICVGFSTQLNTHISHGDVLEGCKFHSKKMMVLGDDSWISGNCIISGIHVGQKSLILPGSILTKNVSSNRVYAGNPAKDITDKIGEPWMIRSTDEKINIFEEYKNQYAKINPNWNEKCVKCVVVLPTKLDSKITYFNVTTRQYTKRYSKEEVEFMTWLTSWKARFTPIG